MRTCAATGSRCSPGCASSSRASRTFPACRADRSNYMQWILSIVFTLFMAVWTISFGVMYCLITPFLNFRGRFWMAGVMNNVCFFGLKWLCVLTYVVEGRENLPAAGNHVIFMKHSSTWETYAIMTLFPPLVWVMKREIGRAHV